MRLLKKVAAAAAATVLMGAAVIPAMAGQLDTYFYLYQNGTLTPSHGGQDCVIEYILDDEIVLLPLQEVNYGGVTGAITGAFADVNGNGIFDEGDIDLFDNASNAIVYNQEELAVVIDGEKYANFMIELTVSGYSHNPQNVYVPHITE